MAQNKKVLLVGPSEDINVARIINGLVAKLSNVKAGYPIRVSSEEKELLSQIVVSSNTFSLN